MKKESEKFESSSLFEGMISLRILLSDKRKRDIRMVYVDESQKKKKARELSYIRAKSYERGFPINIVDHDTFERLTTGQTHGGIAALCSERRIPALQKEHIVTGGFYVMLEGIEDPYNFGYALRSLYAAGADGIILSPRNWMSAAGLVCRASAGASELFDLYEASGEDAARLFKSIGYTVVAAGIKNSVSAYETSLLKPLFLIVGGEKRGISASLTSLCDKTVRLDYGRECPFSLSAASAASILGFEVMRQNKF